MDHKLFIASGVSGGEVLPLTEAQTVLGRDPTCAVVIPDVRMSRRHCIIRVHEGAFFIEDLKSTNGTFVNGRSITRTQLADNDKIVLGSSVIYFGSERPANLSSRGRVMVVDEPPGPHHTYEVSADDVREGLASAAARLATELSLFLGWQIATSMLYSLLNIPPHEWIA